MINAIKGIVGLGLIALGSYIGYHFTVGGVGNGALLGGIGAFLLYCVVLQFGPMLLKKLRPGVKMDDEDREDAFTRYKAHEESERAVRNVRNEAFEELLRLGKSRYKGW